MVAEEEELAAGENGRTGHAIKVFEGAEGVAPTFFPSVGVGDEAEIGEEDVDVFGVGDGGGGSGVIGFVDGLKFGGLEGATPKFASGGEIVGEGEEGAFVGGGEKDAVADDDGGRLAKGYFDLPGDVFGGPEDDGEAFGIGDARAGRAAELGPIGGEGQRDAQGGEQAEATVAHILILPYGYGAPGKHSMSESGLESGCQRAETDWRAGRLYGRSPD